MNPVLEKALEFLHTRNLNKEEPLSNPNDNDKAIFFFRLLKTHEIPFNAEEVQEWALSQDGVSQRHAHALGFLARQIATGMPVEIFDHNNARIIPDNLIEILREEIESDS